MLLVLRFTVFTSVSFSVRLLCCVFQLCIFVASCFNLTQLFLVWCLDLLPSPIIRLIVFSRVFTCSTFPSLSGVYTVWVFLCSLLHHCCRLCAPLFSVLVLAVLLRLSLFSLYYLKVFSDTYQNNIKLSEFKNFIWVHNLSATQSQWQKAYEVLFFFFFQCQIYCKLL